MTECYFVAKAQEIHQFRKTHSKLCSGTRGGNARRLSKRENTSDIAATLTESTGAKFHVGLMFGLLTSKTAFGTSDSPSRWSHLQWHGVFGNPHVSSLESDSGGVQQDFPASTAWHGGNGESLCSQGLHSCRQWANGPAMLNNTAITTTQATSCRNENGFTLVKIPRP